MFHQGFGTNVEDEFLVVVGRPFFSYAGKDKLLPGNPFDPCKAIIAEPGLMAS
jgi:hypothetical protein